MHRSSKNGVRLCRSIEDVVDPGRIDDYDIGREPVVIMRDRIMNPIADQLQDPTAATKELDVK